MESDIVPSDICLRQLGALDKWYRDRDRDRDSDRDSDITLTG